MLWVLMGSTNALLVSTHVFCGQIRKIMPISPLILSYVEFQEKTHLGLAEAGLNSGLVLFLSGLNCGVVLFLSEEK